MNLLFLFIAGIVFIVLGIGLIKYPVFYDSRHQVYQDFTGIEWIIGGAFITVGIYSIFLVIKNKYKGTHIENKQLICPKCEEVVELTNSGESYCPHCGKKLEKLKGFYERHPELKDN